MSKDGFMALLAAVIATISMIVVLRHV